MNQTGTQKGKKAMRGSLVEVYLHFIWATWNRLPLITPVVQEAAYACIIDKCRQYDCAVLAIGGIEDHIHVLLRAAPRLDIPNLARDMKGASSHLITAQIDPEAFFKWQGGYAAYSLDPRSVDRVANYIRKQKEHHRDGTVIPFLENYANDGGEIKEPSATVDNPAR